MKNIQPDRTVNPAERGSNLFFYDSLFSYRPTQPEIDLYERRDHFRDEDYKFAIILLIMLLYVTWLTYTYRRELRENLVVIANSGLGQQIYRDREFSANIFRLLTFTNFSLVTGVALYLAARHFGITLFFERLWLNIAATASFVLIAYILKGTVYRVVGGLYQISPVVSFFRFNSLVIYQMLGIAMFPFIVFAVFAPDPVSNWSLTALLVLACLALIVRLYKGISLLGMLKDFHIVYFLLYICALEIAPVLILIRLFSTWS